MIRTAFTASVFGLLPLSAAFNFEGTPPCSSSLHRVGRASGREYGRRSRPAHPEDASLTNDRPLSQSQCYKPRAAFCWHCPLANLVGTFEQFEITLANPLKMRV